MLAIAIAALVVLSAITEAATTKYDYDGGESYKHEDHVFSELSSDLNRAYGSEYMRRYDRGHEAYKTNDHHYEPFYENHFADRDNREPHHDIYVEDNYGGDAYSEEQTYTYEPRSTYRSKRSVRDGNCFDREAVARATFTQQGVSGTIEFSQAFSSHPVEMCINLSGLGGNAGMFHVHELPVTDNQCSSTGGHFTHGDLSGKHGGLEGEDEVRECFMDTNLSLFGKNSIVNRSVVIHKNPGGDRWVCANILLVR